MNPVSKFPSTENAVLDSLVPQQQTTMAPSPPISSIISDQLEGINPSIMNILRSKTRSNSNDFHNSGLSFGSTGKDVSSTFENLLADYVFGLPASLDEFYKVMGELYVSEILKHRSDLQTPSELMKELLLGASQSNLDKIDTNVVKDLMKMATHESNLQDTLLSATETQLAENLLQLHLNRDFMVPSQKSEESIEQSQKMVDSNNLTRGNIPSAGLGGDSMSTETPLRKREAKSEFKRNKRSLENIPNPISSPTPAPQNCSQEASGPAKEGATGRKSKSTRKRAPKKKNPRVFLSKISNNDEKKMASFKRKCTEQSIEEFCRGTIYNLIKDVL